MNLVLAVFSVISKVVGAHGVVASKRPDVIHILVNWIESLRRSVVDSWHFSPEGRWQEEDRCILLHVGYSNQSEQLAKTTIAHAGEPFTLLEVDKTTIGCAAAEDDLDPGR